jgi:hypothetical protein
VQGMGGRGGVPRHSTNASDMCVWQARHSTQKYTPWYSTGCWASDSQGYIGSTGRTACLHIIIHCLQESLC